MAGQTLPRKEQQLAAVQRRDGQQVKDADVDGQQSQQGQYLPPAVVHGLVDRRHRAEGAGQFLHAHLAGEQVKKAAQNSPAVVTIHIAGHDNDVPQVLFHRLNAEIHAVQHIAVRVARRGEGHILQLQDLAAAQDHHVVGFLLRGVKPIGYVVDRPAGVAANLQNRVAFLQGCGACGVLAEIRNRRAADLAHGKDEHQQHRDAEDKVHQCTAERDKKALPGGGILKFLAADDQREKRGFAGLRGGRRCALPALVLLVVLLVRQRAEQIIAAQRQQADRIGRSVTGRGPQARAKADGKFLDMDTAMARRHKVAQLMHQNDAAKHEQRCQPGQQCSHRHLTSKVLDVEL